MGLECLFFLLNAFNKWLKNELASTNVPNQRLWLAKTDTEILNWYGYLLQNF